MRPKRVVQASTGVSAWIPVDNTQANFNVGISMDVSAGASLTWVVEVTSDDIFNSSVTPTAFVAPAPLDTGTGDEVGNITIPIRAVRVNATITSGSVAMTIVQGRK